MNKRGERPEALSSTLTEEKHSSDLLEQENITRFDNAGKKKRRKPAGRSTDAPEENRHHAQRRQTAEGTPRGERRPKKTRGGGNHPGYNAKNDNAAE